MSAPSVAATIFGLFQDDQHFSLSVTPESGAYAHVSIWKESTVFRRARQ